MGEPDRDAGRGENRRGRVMKAADIRALISVPWQHGACVDLSGVVCEGRLDLGGLDITGINFSGASFPDGFDATRARFLGVSWFSSRNRRWRIS
mgnify:CR=1 FL=1